MRWRKLRTPHAPWPSALEPRSSKKIPPPPRSQTVRRDAMRRARAQSCREAHAAATAHMRRGAPSRFFLFFSAHRCRIASPLEPTLLTPVYRSGALKCMRACVYVCMWGIDSMRNEIRYVVYRNYFAGGAAPSAAAQSRGGRSRAYVRPRGCRATAPQTP